MINFTNNFPNLLILQQNGRREILVWVLGGAFLILILWGINRVYKPGIFSNRQQNKWFLLLLMLILPFSLVFKYEFANYQVLTSSGSFHPPILLLFSGIPYMIAAGIVGPIPAVIVAFLTGIFQFLIFQQDFLLVFVYASIVLVFTKLAVSSEQKGKEGFLRNSFISGILALLLNIPILFLIQLTNSISFSHLSLNLVIEGTIGMCLSLVPTILIASGTCQLFQIWKPAEWSLSRFVNIAELLDPISLAVTQINTLISGQYDQPFENASTEKVNKSLFGALERLRQNLLQRTDTQNRLLSLDPFYYSREAYDLVLSSILRAALGREASAARLVLLNHTVGSSKPEMRLRIGQGDQTRLYAYLDPMILDKIGDQEQLILSDLQLDQYFGLASGMPYPHSIAALLLKHENNPQGILWVGFEENHWFSQDDIKFYRQLASRVSAVLSTKERFNQIQADKNWLYAALNSFTEPVYVFNKFNQLVFSNKSAIDLMKGSKVQEKGQIDPKIVEWDLEKLLDQTSDITAAKPLTSINGEEYEITIYPLKNNEDSMGNMLVLNNTVWNRKLNAQKNEFVTNISHDLRSPLSLIRGYITLLQNIGNLSEEQQKYVSRIQLNIENMSRLVSKVLSLELLDSSETIKYLPFDIKDMIEETIDMLSLQAQQRKVVVKADFSGLKNNMINADRVLLQQAVFNLIENAIKFSVMSGEVSIKSWKDAAKFHFSVQDFGKGIAPLDQPKLFTRFFHIDSDASYEARGQGLGLAITKSVIDKHGGKIWVESQLGEGSTFCFEIPLRKRGN